MKKTTSIRFAALLAALGGCLLATATASAEVLLDDSFADDSRLETDLPNESQVFLSHPDASAMVSNMLRYQIQSSSTKAHVYFAPNSQFSRLGVGDTLTASFSVIPRVSINLDDTSRSFRFGVFHDPTDPHVLEDTNDDGGGDGDPWSDAEGYGVQLAFMSDPANTREVFDLGKRTDLDNSSLLGSSGAYDKSSGGDPAVMSLDTEYTYTMEITKNSETETEITTTLEETGVGELSSYTVFDNGTDLGSDAPYDDFSFIGFRWSNDFEAASVFDFTNISVEGPAVIPEPTTGMLGLISTMLLGMYRRRR